MTGNISPKTVWEVSISAKPVPRFNNHGKANLKAIYKVNKENFPDWKWSDNFTFYQTQDPNYLIVESDREGAANIPGLSLFYHSARFYLTFIMENGLTRRFRELFNPVKEMMDAGVEIPRWRRSITE